MTPFASLSLDLDNQWSYMKTHGDRGWEALPSYLDALAPAVLELLGDLDLRISFFVVGQDAAQAKNRRALAALAEAGHELGNHSFRHEPWLHLYDDEDLSQELSRTEQAIGEATGARVDGFRGPGYSLSRRTLEMLLERGYRYDASTLPTWIGPLARRYYFWSARLDAEKRRERAQLFGSLRDGLQPVKPYRWNLDGGSLLEIPVTTLPFARIPFHVSYVLTLSAVSEPAARAYFGAGLRLCHAIGLAPSILLHPLDLLGADDVDALGFFPGMQLDGATKRARLRTYLSDLKRHFEVVTMGEHATRLEKVLLPERAPRFPGAERGTTG